MPSHQFSRPNRHKWFTVFHSRRGQDIGVQAWRCRDAVADANANANAGSLVACVRVPCHVLITAWMVDGCLQELYSHARVHPMGNLHVERQRVGDAHTVGVQGWWSWKRCIDDICIVHRERLACQYQPPVAGMRREHPFGTGLHLLGRGCGSPQSKGGGSGGGYLTLC